MARQNTIAGCIVRGVSDQGETTPQSKCKRWLAALRTFFALYKVPLSKHEAALFKRLRESNWMIDEKDYLDSFAEMTNGDKNRTALQTMGDMGYSGSTFFRTQNQRYLVKSVPRQFEHSFFRDDLLRPYEAHMKEHQHSILIRITDFLGASQYALGIPLGLAPSHHIVMENLLYGAADNKETNHLKWASFDLKPTSYFFPERDIASGRLSSEANKSRLADEFNDKIFLSEEQASEFLATLESDTKLLTNSNAVDYSLFLVKIDVNNHDPFQDSAIIPNESPFTPSSPPSWRTGVISPDGKHVYRAAILDFFWAKHKAYAKFMTGLIKAWNLIDRQGPMSITTTPDEYRSRFLRMVKDYIEIVKD